MMVFAQDIRYKGDIVDIVCACVRMVYIYIIDINVMSMTHTHTYPWYRDLRIYKIPTKSSKHYICMYDI